METQTQTFTSTLEANLLVWVNEQAKQEKRTRREVLESALRAYKDCVKKTQFVEGFKRVAKDDNMLEMVEWGMDDYRDIVCR